METKGFDERESVSSIEFTRADPLPMGTVTFLFTDIEGSTKLWQEYPVEMPAVIARHDGLLRAAVEAHGGVVFKTVGDSIYGAFPSACPALESALDGQRAILAEPWPPGRSIKVRMAIHTGAAEVLGDDYAGHTLNRVARILSAAHGAQTLVSGVSAELLRDVLPPDVTLVDMGEHRLKDLMRPERLFQVVAPDLPSEFEPLATTEVHPTNLPPDHTPFIGRDRDVRALVDMLRRDGVRLVTMTGPGGTGKTRLAMHVARMLIDRFRDGTYFVALEPVTDSALVPGTIATALGIQEVSAQPVEETLHAALQDKEMLLVLDNFEHLLDAESLVAGLLSAPRLKVLVTSRSVLHLSAEHEYRVPPLQVPDLQHLPEIGALSQYDAVALFIQRARAVKADFTITNDNAPAVAEICHRLDGLPLAIELAAARIKFFPPHALLRRLESRMQLLTGGARDRPARQQTLRATLDWSYHLLTPDEQRLFALLSVFSGATLDAIEAVVGSVETVEPTTVDTLDGLASLANNSLIRHTAADDDEPRLAMLETIREYAAERLSERPAFHTAVHRAHAAYFADFAERQGQQLSSGGREGALESLSDESDNLRIAWGYWVRARDLDHLNKLVDSLWVLYDTRGWYRAIVDLATEVLSILSSMPSTPERTIQEVTLRTGLARTLLAIHGYTQEVEAAYALALETVGENRALPQLFPVLRGLVSFYNYRAEFEKVGQLAQEILRLADAQDDATMRLDGHLMVGQLVLFVDDLRTGLQHLDTAIATFESQGYQPPRFRVGPNPGVVSLAVSAFALWLLGFPDQALNRANRAVQLAIDLKHPLTMAYAPFHAGFLHLWRREPERVRDCAVNVLSVAGDHELPIWEALGTFLLGAAKVGLGRVDEGLTDIEDGLASYQLLKTPPVFWPLILYVRARACAQAGRLDDGQRWIDQAIGIVGTASTFSAEFFLLKGDLLLAGGKMPDAAAWFLRAFEHARGVDARTSQLRAAIGLCRAERELGNAKLAQQRLGTVYATFTEGFTTPDLVDARNLLQA